MNFLNPLVDCGPFLKNNKGVTAVRKFTYVGCSILLFISEGLRLHQPRRLIGLIISECTTTTGIARWAVLYV